MEDLSSQQQHLENTLKQIRDKILHKWTDKELSGHMRSCNTQHQDTIATLKEQANQLQKHIEDCHNEGLNKEKAQKAEEEKAASIKQSSADVQQQSDRLLHEREVLDSDVAAMEREAVQLKQALLTQKERVEQKMSELQKSCQLFQECAGLSFKKISGNRLQVIFTCLDARNSEQNANFSLKITGEKRAYSVSQCDPHVADIDALVEKLNTTNNFRSFIIVMRQRFKQMIQQ